jgi:small subunit ribosomal protein S2
MKPYIFRRRADGLAKLNTNQIDTRIRTAAAFMAQYAPEKIVVSCKREAGWKAIEKFSEITGIKVFSKKYPAGIITNLDLKHFFEPSLMIIIDPWIDKNPMLDAVKIRIPVIALCDSNNVPSKIDLIIPANNKSNKSIGIIFWILAREYNKARGKEVTMPPYEEFIGESI